MKRILLAVACGGAALTVLAADEPVDLDMVNRIRDEGLNRSKVMETAAYLTDRIGPRLTNSPQAREAGEWTRARLAEWGLANAHLESWGPKDADVDASKGKLAGRVLLVSEPREIKDLDKPLFDSPSPSPEQ